ncbi:MAG: hypothetical protein PVG53_11975, partial [Holophagae bacterium]
MSWRSIDSIPFPFTIPFPRDSFQDLDRERNERKGEPNMTVNEALRAMAGIVVLLSLALGYWVSP